MAQRQAPVESEGDAMKYFIVHENRDVANWDDPMYRQIVLAGFTCSEVELREWATRLVQRRGSSLKFDSPVEEIATAVAVSGWSILEKIS